MCRRGASICRGLSMAIHQFCRDLVTLTISIYILCLCYSTVSAKAVCFRAAAVYSGSMLKYLVVMMTGNVSLCWRYDNYGGDWASYNFTAIQQWVESFNVCDRSCSCVKSDDCYSAFIIRAKVTCVLSYKLLIFTNHKCRFEQCCETMPHSSFMCCCYVCCCANVA